MLVASPIYPPPHYKVGYYGTRIADMRVIIGPRTARFGPQMKAVTDMISRRICSAQTQNGSDWLSLREGWGWPAFCFYRELRNSHMNKMKFGDRSDGNKLEIYEQN